MIKKIVLTAEDHTKIIDACMKGTFSLFKRLGGRRLIIKRKIPEPKDVLAVLHEVVHLDDRTQKAVDQILKDMSSLPDWKTTPSSKTRNVISEIKEQLRKQTSISEMIKYLENLKQSKKYTDVEGISDAISTASEILITGQDSIYSDLHPFNEMFTHIAPGENHEPHGDSPSVGGRLGMADLRGALDGLLTPTPGGTIGGAVISSIKEGVEIACEALCN